jgi:hypothetical protein
MSYHMFCRDRNRWTHNDTYWQKHFQRTRCSMQEEFEDSKGVISIRSTA